MSPRDTLPIMGGRGPPRASGDEPHLAALLERVGESAPRQRG